MGWFDEQIKERRKREQDNFADAMDEISSVITRKAMGSGTRNPEASQRSQVEWSVGKILEYYHLKPRELPENIKSFSLSSYRESFGTVFQDFKMFSMSVKDNVLLRPAKDGDDELVTHALKESGAYEKISRLDKGLDTILTREFDSKGENLSVGEQQKLSLARVFKPGRSETSPNRP